MNADRRVKPENINKLIERTAEAPPDDATRQVGMPGGVTFALVSPDGQTVAEYGRRAEDFADEVAW